MSATLNEIAESLAERAGRQFDTPFNEEIKVFIQLWRARLLRDTLEQNRRDRMFFKQYFEVPLEVANISDLPGFPDLRVLKTTCKLPKPLRANSTMWDYIGSPDKLSNFKVFTELHKIIPALDAKYTGHLPKALLLNDDIWIFNNLELKYLGVQGILEDPRELKDYTCNCGCEVCYDDNQPYPVSDDIKQRIVQSILSVELKDRIKPDTKTVEVDGNSQT